MPRPLSSHIARAATVPLHDEPGSPGSQPRPRARPRHRSRGAWPPPAGWGAATRRAPTAPPSTRCASCSAPCPMDGIVVIGEGEKDEAPMLYNGEQHRRRHAAADRHRRRSDRRHHAHRPRPGQRDRRDRRRPSGARCSTPGPCVYMEKIAVGPEAAGVIDITKSPTENLARGRRGQGRVGPRPHRGHPRPRPPRASSSTRSARPAPASGSSPTATSPARSRPHGPTPGADILFGIGGTPEGVITAAALKCMGGAACRAASGPATSAERNDAPSTPATTSTQVLTDRRPRPQRQLLLRRHRHHRRRAAPGRALRQPGLPPPQSLVMRSKSGTVRRGQRPPPDRQARRVQRRRLRLTRQASAPTAAS